MLFCICCNTFCFGGVYAWSAFSGELANYMGWDYSKVTVAYSIMLMCVALMGLVGGMLLQRFGARKLMIAAGECRNFHIKSLSKKRLNAEGCPLFLVNTVASAV